MTTTHRALTFLGTLTAGAMIAASTIATAHAEAQEYARLAAKAYAECLARNHDNDTEVC